MKKIYKIEADFNGDKVDVEIYKDQEDVLILDFINPKKRKERHSLILKLEDIESICSEK